MRAAEEGIVTSIAKASPPGDVIGYRSRSTSECLLPVTQAQGYCYCSTES
jgi:hypothetical protein